MKGKLVEWWRLALIAVMLGVILFVVLESGQSGYLTVQVLMLFAALFFGHRFGAGTGAIAGVTGGIILGIMSGKPAQMGILCLLGIFAGAFRRLGKMASLTAYAAAAFGAGILYSPALLFETMQSVLAGGAVFMLLPERLTQAEHLQEGREDEGKIQAAAVWQAAFEGTAGERLEPLAQTFSMLSSMYREEELCSEENEPDWKLRYIELRQLLSEQLGECGEMLKDSIGQVEEKEELSGQVRQELIQQLSRVGVEAQRIFMTETRDKKREIMMALSSKSQRCISMKLVCEQAGHVLGRNMALCADQPLLVSSVPRWVRFEEDTEYFTIFGVAGSCRDGNDVSGDSFSCLELPGGKKVLFICDGMGSGKRAGRESAKVTELAELMCRAGYPPSMIIRVINSALMIQAREHPVTIDMVMIDCANGMCEVTKSGAAVTFLKRGSEAEQVGADSMPAGILQEYAPMEKMLRLKDSDLLIMVSDGVLEELPVLDKEEAMQRFCAELTENNPKEIARKILKYACKNSAGRDDMTILVAGIWKK